MASSEPGGVVMVMVMVVLDPEVLPGEGLTELPVGWDDVP